MEDYRALHDFGAAIGQKLYCAFVVGEWDLEDRLGKEIPHFSHFGENWNNSAYRDPEALRQAAEIVERSPYIDVAVHGLYHGYYTDGIVNHDVSDYYYNKHENDLTMVPEAEIRLRLDHFFRICRKYGIHKPIKGFVPPTGAYRGFELSSILRDYGILYNVCSFPCLQKYTDTPDVDALDNVFVDNDIIVVKQQSSPGAHWWSYDSDFRECPPSFGVAGLHWPNVLHFDPTRHGETLAKMVPWFKRCAEVFGIVISSGIEFCATQELTRKYAIVEEGVLDLSEVPAATGRLDHFTFSARLPLTGIENAEILGVEEHKGFLNYDIKPLGDRIILK